MSQFGIMNTLDVEICESSKEAQRRGFFYRPPVYKPIEIEKVVVVQKGMASGASTVDLIMVDEKGQKYVVMLTSALLKSIPAFEGTQGG